MCSYLSDFRAVAIFQTLNRLFIVNAGSGFKMLWKAVKAFLDTRTLAKIQVRVLFSRAD